ncbi:uncharacterized protein N7469_007054 [Penicillium citrinum]|uniref:DNA (cytosine-5)-methyltransferase 1 replication foci domain-containing protein n=2 Tax=Penicillium TaxID=5073 RepID=A0A9W9NY01_PENCI|nr:uncharacterized protein N7469_007054 [Penicillium citrinum]KAJ5227048.1 hypothetical protein N7469_007054 [Penicillium citrinum]KAJ5568490.1 hypothetical protein N7450_010976 [Penicillium hetheringtonii]KAK5791319.1 hypothetical protein VI817_006628 [Penicillium citrinum]
MTSREETVLPPIDPSIGDENEWPEFELTDAKVLRPGKMLYANLLDASEQTPVQVIGCLELKKAQEELLLEPEKPNNRIVLDNVTHYAYGQMEDRSVEMWAAGKAGWYKIAPAKGYLPHFNRMVQAVDTFYFLMDKHQHGRKQLNPSFKSLCEQYVFHTHGACETADQSAEVFSEHSSFLMRCMIEEDDDGDVEWSKTNFFHHLRRQHKVCNMVSFSPDEYKTLVGLHSPRKTDMNDLPDAPEASTPRHEPAAIAKSQANAVYQLIIQLKKEGHLAKRRLNLDLLVERFSEMYSVDDEDARKIIAARARLVLEMLDEDDTPSFKWSRYAIHRDLTNAASETIFLPPALLTPLQPTEDSSDDEQLGRTQKSVLRPKMNSSVSGKVMGKRNRNANSYQNTQSDHDGQDDAVDDEEEDEAMEDVETPSKVRGHELIRTPLASAKPRTRSILGNNDSAAASLLKSVLSAETPRSGFEPKATKGRLSFGLSRPSVETNGLGESETWTCRVPGCSKTITSKGEQRTKEIEDHAGEHDWETQMQVELVESERRLQPARPVSHLMQYLLNQHYQQMRAAFPEIYPPEGVNGITAAEEPNTPTPNEDESHALELHQDLSAELDLSVNGYAT